MRSRRTKPGEGRGSDERSQLDGRRVRADEAARVAGFGQTKLRGWRGSEKESSATVEAQTKAAEQLNGKETGKPSATGGTQTEGAEQRAASSGGKGQHDRRSSS